MATNRIDKLSSFYNYGTFVCLGFQAGQHGPTILDTSSPPVVYTERGKSIRIKCDYHAEPEPKVNWIKNGVEIRHNCDTCIAKVKVQAETSILEITPYLKEDFGDYECRVRNIYGSSKMKVSLKETELRQTRCEKERLLSADPRKKRAFRPTCDEDGSYHDVQCSIEHDLCWCVNKYGKKTLDVIDGSNGLRCFAPKDLSVVAIVVLTQGILVTIVLIDQIINAFGYKNYSVYGALMKYYGQRVLVPKKRCKVLKKEMQENNMKWRPLPAVPGNVQKKKKRKMPHKDKVLNIN
ncbi:uncharacterized protein LOC114530983 [Dendronephthya gigantea]|uniref:uncharacterized protein LOC114530983 n=1 Tax=Dendronephthya gigantea TaxID=151771 RepID=UPI00106A4756|nr:uncharacterized protein LOC114530983 [Dendronephthya gigantea]